MRRTRAICDSPLTSPDTHGDGGLGQILTNLLGNALKCTECGDVLLEVSEQVRGHAHTELHFLVSDTGIGIPRNKHTTIFDAFSQADGSTTRQFGGTGLGLTISATLVRMMGGRMWVESDVGAGSTFHFTAAFDTAAEPMSVRRRPTVRGVSVLVVDDNAVNRRILGEQLSRGQMRPTLVNGGRAALNTLTDAALAGRPFAVVLLDANMPDCDGFTVAEEIGVSSRGDDHDADVGRRCDAPLGADPGCCRVSDQTDQ